MKAVAKPGNRAEKIAVEPAQPLRRGGAERGENLARVGEDEVDASVSERGNDPRGNVSIVRPLVARQESNRIGSDRLAAVRPVKSVEDLLERSPPASPKSPRRCCFSYVR
jgi:hypothetical protein